MSFSYSFYTNVYTFYVRILTIVQDAYLPMTGYGFFEFFFIPITYEHFYAKNYKCG